MRALRGRPASSRTVWLCFESRLPVRVLSATVAIFTQLLLASCMLVGAACRGHAQEPSSGASARPEHGYWSHGEPRWFVSSRSELGTPYIRPYFSAGYGMPHWIWAGVDTYAISTGEFLQTYGGVRAASPVFDVAFGVRDTWSYDKPLLVPARRYSGADVLGAPGRSARYLAWEVEAVAIAPLPYSALVADLVIVRTLDVPSGFAVYDESYRAVVRDKLFITLRAAAVGRFLREQALKLGVLGEYVFDTGRSAGVVRLGPVMSVQLTDHLEINLAVTVAVSSPDNLGVALGAFGIAGFRYRWATGESQPRWPWSGPVIP